MKPLVAVVLLAIAAFCVYGFIASFEPGPRAIYFRIGYAVAGLAFVAAALAVIRRRT